MAIFASANSTGYGDPIKALSIKALEQRQKDMLAQQAGQQFDAASMATIPGGIGHVLGIVGDNMRQGQTDAALASNRAALAQAMTGYDASKGMTPEQRGVLARVAPEILDKLLTHEQETRQLATTEGGLNKRSDAQIAGQAANVAAQEAAAGARTHETVEGQKANTAAQETGAGTRQQQKLEAEKAAAAEAARVAQEAADAQERRIQARPSEDPAAQVVHAEKSGELPPDIAKRRLEQVLGPKAAEQNIINKESTEAIENQSTLNTLDEAVGLLNSPKGVQTGNYAGAAQTIGEHLPGFLQGNQYLPDPDVTKNTQRYNQIMDQEAMNLVIKMKGSSSDRDVDRNYKIASNPNATKEARIQAIGVLKEKYVAFLAQNKHAIAAAGGETPALPKPVSTSADPGKVNAGADPGRAAAVDPAAPAKVVEGITEAQAKALPAGTRFKLIDGRTGTAR